MKNTIKDLKQKLGENTEKIEKQTKKLWADYSPNYTNLEPYQRGLLLLGIFSFLAVSAYYLTKEDKDRTAIRKAKEEALQEERMIKKLELFKKLRE